MVGGLRTPSRSLSDWKFTEYSMTEAEMSLWSKGDVFGRAYCLIQRNGTFLYHDVAAFELAQVTTDRMGRLINRHKGPTLARLAVMLNAYIRGEEDEAVHAGITDQAKKLFGRVSNLSARLNNSKHERLEPLVGVCPDIDSFSGLHESGFLDLLMMFYDRAD